MRSHAPKLSPRTIALAALVVVALVIAGCGGTSYGSGSSSKPAQSTSAPASSAAAGGIPQNNGGDHDGDNNGGPSDGDGNI